MVSDQWEEKDSNRRGAEVAESSAEIGILVSERSERKVAVGVPPQTVLGASCSESKTPAQRSELSRMSLATYWPLESDQIPEAVFVIKQRFDAVSEENGR